ncbi:MAG: hypothetical protein AAFN27_09265 [Pseudomonadota bacterium]
MTEAAAPDLASPATANALSLTVFVIGSAILYAGAMVAMKFWGQVSPTLLLLIIALMVGGGVWLEIGALQTERLAMVYVLILGAECILIAIASALWFGETFSAREILGGGLIVLGTAIAWI